MCAEDALDIRGLKWEDSLWQVSFLIIFEVHRMCVWEREREEGGGEEGEVSIYVCEKREL